MTPAASTAASPRLTRDDRPATTTVSRERIVTPRTQARTSGERPVDDAEIAALLEELEIQETPTLPPPFDLETYARQQSQYPSERRAPSERPTEPALEDPNASTTRIKTHRAVPAARPSDAQELRSRLADQFFGGDYASALATAEELLVLRPDDPSASDFSEECRRLLEKQRAANFGDLDAVPVLTVALHELRGLDHRAGFLLSRVDGELTLDGLLDVSGMPRDEAMQILQFLVERGILHMKRPR